MLKPHDMARMIITGPKRIQKEVIEELHSMKVLHIVDHSKSEIADIGIPSEDAKKYSEILVKARALISSLGIKKDNSKAKKLKIDEIEKSVIDANNKLYSINEEIKNCEESKSNILALKQELDQLKDIRIPIEDISETKYLCCFLGAIKDELSFEKIKKDISKFNFAIEKREYSGKIIAVIFVDSKNKEKANEILQKNGFSQINLVNAKNLKGTAYENISKIENKLLEIETKKLELLKKIENLKSEKESVLISAENYLTELLEKAEAPLRFANTKSSFLIKGWVPKEDLSKTISRIEKLGNEKVHVYSDNPKSNDKVPIKLNNPKIAKPFEFFIDLYSYPSHKEIDPTLFMFFTFPLFFGVMLGDVGYGIVGLLVFWLVKKKIPQGAGLLNSLIVSAFMSILFGLMFGEFFGYEFIHHPIISREKEMMKLMYFAVALGVMHVNLGLIAGFINESKSHGFMHAVYAKLSWMILEAGVVVIAIPYVTPIKIAAWIGYSLVGLAAIMLFKGEGPRGLIELPSIFTNILSYARLMAIGLSSVIIAVIVNESAIEMIHQGGFIMAAGLMIMIIGHLLNILLGLFGSFLHSLRLHYVEFFSKFFHGGGKKYAPFGLKE